MSRLSELIRDLCPDGVEYRTLSNCVILPSIPRGLKRMQYETNAPFPIVDQGRGRIAGYSSDVSRLVKDVPGIIFGDHTREIKYIDFPYVPGAEGIKWIRATGDVALRYLFHYLKSLRIPSRGYNRHWGTVRDLPVPVPPLEVQQEVVRILDQFTTLEAELEAELEARRKQYDHYRNVLIRSVSCESGNHWVQLRDLGSWVGGGTPSKERAEFWEGGCIPWVTPKDMGNSVVRDSQDHITETAVMGSSVRLVEAPSLAVVVRSSILQRTLPIADVVVDATFNQDMKVLRVFDDYCRRYVFHVLRASSDRLLVECRKQGGSVNSLVTSRFLKSEIPIPPLDRQRHIADTLDRFDALVNSISSGLPAEIAARRKQYEHYRNMVLTFPERRR